MSDTRMVSEKWFSNVPARSDLDPRTVAARGWSERHSVLPSALPVSFGRPSWFRAPQLALVLVPEGIVACFPSPPHPAMAGPQSCPWQAHHPQGLHSIPRIAYGGRAGVAP